MNSSLGDHPLKRLGHCSVCDLRVFGTGPKGIEMGAPTDEAIRAKVCLIDGSLASVTLCRACSEEPDFGRLAEAMLGAWWLELDDAYRISCGGTALEPRQRVALRDTFNRQRLNPPIGIAYATPWARVFAREALGR